MTLEAEHDSEADSRQKHGRSRVSNGSALLTGADGRGVWARRFRDVLREHIQDLGGEANTSAAERAILKRCAGLVCEIERMETRFALADEAVINDQAIDLYNRASANLKRLLESVGLERRSRLVSNAADERILNYIDQQDPAE